MDIKFSPSSIAFFFSEVNGQDVPDDAVDISFELHSYLMDQQAIGKVIAAGSDGLPVAVDPPPPSLDAQADVLRGWVRAHLDTMARLEGFSGIADAISYADEPAVESLQKLGKAFREWRSLVVAESNAVLAEVVAGAVPVPSSESLIASLPKFPSLE